MGLLRAMAFERQLARTQRCFVIFRKALAEISHKQSFDSHQNKISIILHILLHCRRGEQLVLEESLRWWYCFTVGRPSVLPRLVTLGWSPLNYVKRYTLNWRDLQWSRKCTPTLILMEITYLVLCLNFWTDYLIIHEKLSRLLPPWEHMSLIWLFSI